MSEEYRTSMQEKLTAATEEELLLAAEALVDAALYFHNTRGKHNISDSLRSLLVRTIVDDPTLTKELFTRDCSFLH